MKIIMMFFIGYILTFKQESKYLCMRIGDELILVCIFLIFKIRLNMLFSIFNYVNLHKVSVELHKYYHIFI